MSLDSDEMSLTSFWRRLSQARLVSPANGEDVAYLVLVEVEPT